MRRLPVLVFSLLLLVACAASADKKSLLKDSTSPTATVTMVHLGAEW